MYVVCTMYNTKLTDNDLQTSNGDRLEGDGYISGRKARQILGKDIQFAEW
jgi:hypothetical protein